MKKRGVVMVCALMLFSSGVLAETLQELYKKSVEAYEQKDYQGFLQANQAALKLHPSQPTILYNTAAAYALTGDPKKSLHMIQKLMSWNSGIKIDEAADFATVKTLPEFEALEQWQAKFTQEHKKSQPLQTSFKDLHVEAVLSFADDLLVTDVHYGRLLRFNPDKPGAMETIVSIPEAGMAVLPANKKGHVWLSGAMMPQYAKFDAEKENTSHLYLVDINNKRIAKTYAIPGKSVIGSMISDDAGTLYLSSSAKPIIFTLEAEAEEIKTWLAVDSAINLQGIDYDAKNNALWVGDYIKGIARINVADQSVDWVQVNDYLLKGVDGLNLVSDGLIAIQNNATPKRVVKVTVDEHMQAQVTLLDNGIFPEGEPTNGFYNAKDKTYTYVANSPWPFYSKENVAQKDEWPALMLRQITL